SRRFDVPSVAEDGEPGFRRRHPITLEMNIERFLVINASIRGIWVGTPGHGRAGSSSGGERDGINHMRLT
ncbi:MAG: hypothetical protein PHP55_03445, partial [Methanoculleus sp.]|nr:hypothetical protein [Methanoculleus sp.]